MPGEAAAASIFARIVSGAIPCHKVFENEFCLAFLDLNPLAEGHTLVIPRRPVERLEDLPPEEAAGLARHIGAIARRVLRAVGAADYNLLQNNGRDAGQVVAYVHFHIIPRKPGDGLGYRWNAQQRTQEQLASLAQRINSQP
ncbi:HIT-like protein [Phycisphaerae bacterium RAS1]|nr:HIT-like protein [Phycisphaerae bacterium RAS1]